MASVDEATGFILGMKTLIRGRNDFGMITASLLGHLSVVFNSTNSKSCPNVAYMQSGSVTRNVSLSIDSRYHRAVELIRILPNDLTLLDN